MENERKPQDNRELDKLNTTGTDNTKNPDGLMPEDDPAIINPDELASFPDEVKTDNPDIDDERDPKLVNRKTSPVREGRNITRTDTTHDTDGFM